MSDEKDILRGFDNWEECAKYYREQWDEAHHEIEQLVKVKNHFKERLKETVTSYAIDRRNLVAMTLERDEFDEANKKLSAELKSYKQWLKEREESMKRMEDEIKVLETKIQFIEPYKELYEDYKARYEFEENPPEIEEIFVTSSCPEDVYAAFIDKDRAQWDAKESGTELCSIKLHRGPKAIFNDNEKDS